VLSLTGTVTESTMGNPVAEVQVRVEDMMGAEIVTVQTGPDGKYGAGALADGNYNARFMHMAYPEVMMPFQVIEGETTILDVQMNSMAPPPPMP